nr:immunoglobulin heavy chain junction region [Macaca mulatta]
CARHPIAAGPDYYFDSW